MTPRAQRNPASAGDGSIRAAMMGMVNDDGSDQRDLIDLAAAKAGDDEAFARLYDRHAPVVLSLCRRRLGGIGVEAVTDAEDATQETFIRAHRLLPRLDGAEVLRPWLYGIARRVCSERRRSAARRARHEGDAMLDTMTRTNPPPTAADTVDRAEDLDRLTAALERLGDRERLAVHLYYLDADPVRAAASALRVSRSGYYKLLARARERLAAFMQGPRLASPAPTFPTPRSEVQP